MTLSPLPWHASTAASALLGSSATIHQVTQKGIDFAQVGKKKLQIAGGWLATCTQQRFDATSFRPLCRQLQDVSSEKLCRVQKCPSQTSGWVDRK